MRGSNINSQISNNFTLCSENVALNLSHLPLVVLLCAKLIKQENKEGGQELIERRE